MGIIFKKKKRKEKEKTFSKKLKTWNLFFLNFKINFFKISRSIVFVFIIEAIFLGFAFCFFKKWRDKIISKFDLFWTFESLFFFSWFEIYKLRNTHFMIVFYFNFFFKEQTLMKSKIEEDCSYICFFHFYFSFFFLISINFLHL